MNYALNFTDLEVIQGCQLRYLTLPLTRLVLIFQYDEIYPCASRFKGASCVYSERLTDGYWQHQMIITEYIRGQGHCTAILDLNTGKWRKPFRELKIKSTHLTKKLFRLEYRVFLLILHTDGWKITQRLYELIKADKWIEVDIPKTIFNGRNDDGKPVNEWRYDLKPNMILQLDKRFCK